MEIKEFLNKWECKIIGSNQKPASQLIIDFIEDILLEHEEDDFPDIHFKGSIAYRVDNLLEICDKENLTYLILLEMKKDLK